MDKYLERIIEKQKNGAERMQQILTVIFSVMLLVFFYSFIASFDEINDYVYLSLPPLTFGVGYFAVKFIKKLNIEYEIIITNQYFDLDKITAKSKRERLIALDIKEFWNFNRYDKNKMDKSVYKQIFYAYNQGDENLYYIDVNQNGIRRLVVFSADDEMLSLIKRNLSKEVKQNVSYWH